MMPHRQTITIVLIVLFMAIIACTSTSQNYAKLAEHLHSPEGFANWQSTEAQLAIATESARTEYNRVHTMESLRVYENAIREYLDHGFVLYHALSNSSYDLPRGLRQSLELRTMELMDVAEGYLKEGSTPVAVGIARDVILKYNVGRMDRAQHRAEGILMEYRYERNY
jgi:hypothetical protein